MTSVNAKDLVFTPRGLQPTLVYRANMTQPRLGLIQTVGWETLPPLVAALAVRPVAIGHVHLPDSVGASKRADRAINSVLGKISVYHRTVGIDDPLLETREAVRELLQKLRDEHACDRIIVHVTGSTKIIAIGAYEVAREEGVECLYLELPRGDEDGVPQVISLGTGKLSSDELAALGVDPSTRMTLDLIARAHGYDLPGTGLDYKPYVGFARLALEDEDAEEMMHQALPAEGGGRAPWPDEPMWQKWMQPFTMPKNLQHLAIEANLLEETGGRVRLVDPGVSVPHEERRATFARNASLLRGAWLEIALADAVAATPYLRDVRWSVEAEMPRPMEHDVLALKGTTLVVCSAKRSIQPGIFGHLRELRAHAHRLGGMMGIPVLAIARTDRRRTAFEANSVAEDLLVVAESLGVKLVSRDDICKRDLKALKGNV